MEKSAFPKKTKMTVMAQEVIRRMRNSSPNLSVTERIEILDNMMKKMKTSGYSEGQRREALYAGMMGYCRMRLRERLTGRKVNRPREEGEEERRTRKVLGDATWFQQKEKEPLPDLHQRSRTVHEQQQGECDARRSRRPAHRARGRPPT